MVVRVARVGAVLISLVSLALLLGACTLLRPAGIPTDDELIGNWVNSADGGTLSIRGDGTFAMNGIPEDALLVWDITNPADVPVGRPIDVEGTWENTARRDSAGHPVVEVVFVAPGSDVMRRIDVLVYSQSGSLQLRIGLGDPDDLIFYTFDPDS